ncbi:MAG: aminopeptidase P N-terminal domain-containing protein [Bradymonadia bacterium]|jgi:Xaa-Pro aminopeptidase
MNYRQRQERLAKAMSARSASLFINPAPAHKSADADYPYHPDNHMRYICGLEEPLAVFIVLSEDLGQKRIALVKERDLEMERWLGPTLGLEGAKEWLEADEAYALKDLDEILDKVLFGLDTLYYDFSRHPMIGAQILASIGRLRRRGRKAAEGPRVLADLSTIVGDMRRIKDEDEIALLRKAAAITVEGFQDAMRVIAPGAGEWEVEAELFRGFRRRGASSTSFESIVAAGEHATTLHYVSNDSIMKDGELLLMDAGALYRGYAGDISRTFPVNGRYTGSQREIYALVLAAMKAGIDAARVGNLLSAPHDAVRKVFSQGLHDLGIIKQSPEQIYEEKLDFAYFMHGTSHYIGLDTHDCGTAYRRGDDQAIALDHGVVISVEPGLYFPSDCEEVPEAYRGIGVRIEDDILVTHAGPDNLTEALVKEIDDVEHFMREQRR